MRLSTKGRYAVRSMVDLALHADDGPVTREEIAARQEISADYLARLFARLVKAGLISSVKGPGGGYVLAQSTAAITAGDIIRAVQEPLAPVYCVNTEAGRACHRVDGCVAHLLWEQLGERITELLDSVTLEELCEDASQLQKRMIASVEDPVPRASGSAVGDRSCKAPAASAAALGMLRASPITAYMGHTLSLITEECIYNAISMGRITGDDCPGFYASVLRLSGSAIRRKYIRCLCSDNSRRGTADRSPRTEGSA